MSASENTQTPTEILAFYTAQPPRGIGFNGQPIPNVDDRGIQILTRALTLARNAHAPALIAQIASLLGVIHLDRFYLHEARQRIEESSSIFRALDDREALCRELATLAVIEFYRGNAKTAQGMIREAVEKACEVGQIVLSAYFLCTEAAITSYLGQYQAAESAFEQAHVIFAQHEDEFGRVWWNYIHAREYARDCCQYEQAIERLEAARSTLQTKAVAQPIIEMLLALADSYTNIGKLEIANQLIIEADEKIAEAKCFWYRPESCLIKTQISLLTGNTTQALRQVYSGLGVAGDQGDLRILTGLYRLLAAILELERSRAEDAFDALERGMAAGRVQGRCIELAMALRQAGLHLKRFANRPTLRARGSGFLFEADRMFNEMHIPLPPLPKTGPLPPLAT
jgi:tetratricopeptide (TPR) repeat protein